MNDQERIEALERKLAALEDGGDDRKRRAPPAPRSLAEHAKIIAEQGLALEMERWANTSENPLVFDVYAIDKHAAPEATNAWNGFVRISVPPRSEISLPVAFGPGIQTRNEKGVVVRTLAPQLERLGAEPPTGFLPGLAPTIEDITTETVKFC